MVQSSLAASYLSTHQHYHNCNSECVISLITRSSRKTGLSFKNCIIWGFPELTTGRVSYFELSRAWLCPSAWPGQTWDSTGLWLMAVPPSLWDKDSGRIWKAQLSEACYEPDTLHMLYIFLILFTLLGENTMNTPILQVTTQSIWEVKWVSKGHTASSWD